MKDELKDTLTSKDFDAGEVDELSGCTLGCEAACWFAKEMKCVCACGGKNHGVALELRLTSYKEVKEYFEAEKENDDGYKDDAEEDK